MDIHCTLEGSKVSFSIDPSLQANDIMKLVRSLKPGSETKIPKLYHQNGCIIPIGPNIPQNSEESSYKLVLNDSLALSALKNNAKSNAIKDMEFIQKKLSQLNDFSYTASSSKKMIVKPAVVKVEKLMTTLKLSFPSTKRYSQEEYEALKTSSFDLWKYDEEDMCCFLIYMFKNLGLVSHFSIQEKVLEEFISAVRASYNPNPFHNFKHAFSVSQMIYAMLYMSKLTDKLNMNEKLSLLLGALSHDLDHPGFNNAFQMNALTELAITYNDASPLENHHAAMLFSILRYPKVNILSGLSANDYKDVRKMIILCILATDMGKHAELLTRLRETSATFSLDDPNHRSLLFQILLKCADISNEARPTNVSEPWVDLLLQEFFRQSDTEKLQGLPFAPFMDREKVTKASAQVGFIGFVLIPLMDEVAKVIPEFKTIVAVIQSAKEYYLSRIQ